MYTVNGYKFPFFVFGDVTVLCSTKNQMEAKMNKRIIMSLITLVVFILFVLFSWYMSSKDGKQSNVQSNIVADYIESVVADNFPINHQDTFWRVTFNLILRKFAHFIVYMFIAIAGCVFLSVLTKRIWLAAILMFIGMPFLAYLDEYRQGFVAGRSPRWFDVRVDTAGAYMGIIVTTIVLTVIWYIKKLKKRIAELEE